MVMNEKFKLSLLGSFGRAFLYLVILVIGVLINRTIWREYLSDYAPFLNLITNIVLSILFFLGVSGITGWTFDVQITFRWLIFGMVIAISLFLLSSLLIDPLLDQLFPTSEAEYRDAVAGMMAHPVIGFIQVVVFAPFVEETLIRGFILTGLNDQYGALTALAVSTLIFAALHFNYVQTISALMMGLILGIVHLKSDSLLACIGIHAAYNLLSYIQILFIDGKSVS